VENREKIAYFGSYDVTVDDKGRIMIPVKLREEFKVDCEGNLVMSQAFRTNCVSIYPNHEFDRVRDELFGQRNSSVYYQDIMRTIVGTAQKCVLPKSGRILIPRQLRTFNSINSDAVLIGMGTRVELWDLERWHDHHKAVKDSDTDAYDKVLKKFDF